MGRDIDEAADALWLHLHVETLRATRQTRRQEPP
jgi:hypothetical protein